jgi:hypothetical protein
VSEASGGLCTFTGNGTFTFEFEDSYGNTGTETAMVNRIDRTLPAVVSVTYTPTTPTAEKSLVTMVFNKSVSVS